MIEKTLEFPAMSLTNAYKYTTFMEITDYNQVLIDIQWVKGSSTSLEVVIQFSTDKLVWNTYQRCVDGSPVVCEDRVYQWTVAGNKSIALPVAHKFIRLGAKVTGAVTGATLSARCIASNI